jgi:hypothetical protein
MLVDITAAGSGAVGTIPTPSSSLISSMDRCNVDTTKSFHDCTLLEDWNDSDDDNDEMVEISTFNA